MFSKKHLLVLIFVGISIGFTGACNHAQVIVSSKKPGEKKPAVRLSYYLGGLLPVKRQFQQSDLCGEKGVNRAHSWHSFTDVIFTYLTVFIYAPKHFEVTCNAEAGTSHNGSAQVAHIHD